MFQIFEAQPNDLLNVLLAFVLLFVMVFLVYLSADRYFKERRRYNDEKEILMDGVLSRSAMMSIIAQGIAQIQKRISSPCYMSTIDRFSEYNTAFGYKEANRLLEKIASNIKEAVPRGIKVGRDHADQFYVYIGNEWNRNKALEIAQTIKKVIEKPIKLFGDTEVKVTSSIGIAFYPMHGENFKELNRILKNCCLYHQKNGGNGMRIYSEEMDKQEGQYVDYYYQIKNAILKKEFQLYYHPIINVKTKELYGFEALIRWNHPEFGVLAPYKFLNIMEQSGDIHWIGFWGLETVIKAFLEIKQEYADLALKIFFNLKSQAVDERYLSLEFKKYLKNISFSANNFILRSH
jgi:diguanylate cyclase (GGDEF)-like protein